MFIDLKSSLLLKLKTLFMSFIDTGNNFHEINNNLHIFVVRKVN